MPKEAEEWECSTFCTPGCTHGVTPHTEEERAVTSAREGDCIDHPEISRACYALWYANRNKGPALVQKLLNLDLRKTTP